MNRGLQQHLQKLLRDERKRRGWSLEDLSGQTGLSRSLLSQIENGKQRLTVETAHKLALAFDDGEGLYVNWAQALASNDLGEVSEALEALRELVAAEEPDGGHTWRSEVLAARPSPPASTSAPRRLSHDPERVAGYPASAEEEEQGHLPGFGVGKRAKTVRIPLVPEGEDPRAWTPSARAAQHVSLPRAFFGTEGRLRSPFAYWVSERTATALDGRLRPRDIAIFDRPGKAVDPRAIDAKRDVFAVRVYSAVMISRLRWSPPELHLATRGSRDRIVIRPVEDADAFHQHVIGRLIAVLSHWRS